MKDVISKIMNKIKGWKTLIFSVLVQAVLVLDYYDIKELLPDGKYKDLIFVIIVFVFIYLRHVTDSKPGWKK